MKPNHMFATVAFAALALTANAAIKTSVNNGWSFMLSADSIAPAAPGYDDSRWRQVCLPHDWSVEQPFSKDAPSGNDGAYLPTGAGWYRRTLAVPKSAIGKKLQLYFEGAYMKTDVYVNGHKAATTPYGYSSFFVDITPYVHEGDNTIAVRVDNSMQKNCRWYSGSGIYRNVWLLEQDKARIANWGVKVSTPTLTQAIVATKVANESDTKRHLTVTTRIGALEQSSPVALLPGETKEVVQRFDVPDAKPWSPDSPNMQQAQVQLTEGGKVIDSESPSFGFRTIEWSAAGLKLNGKDIILNGGCAHHDNGILGAAAYDRAEQWRAEQLKAAGFNAVRTSHNIPSEAFLDACDRVGLLVIDEAFDGWRDAKNSHDYHLLFDSQWQSDLDVMLNRDFNHPSIFCWSIGNEVIERDKIEVVTTARNMVARCHEVDSLRPVTSALANWGKRWETYDPLAEAHDIVGYNYTIHESESDHLRAPQRVMMQTESYPKDAWENFRKTKDHPYIVGDFVWTAIDYLGESGIGRWYYEGDVPGEHFHRPLYPWHAAYCGDIDLTGLRKPVSHYRSMLWNEDGDEHLYIAVREPNGYKGEVKTTMWGTWPTFRCWNWPGHEGKDIDVEVYSHYPAVRLCLGDSVVSVKNTQEMKATFTLPYAEGVLKAEGLNADGSVAEVATLATAGSPAALRVTADRTDLNANTSDLAFIIIEIIDKEGNVVPIADNALEVTVSGPATLAALGNADIKDTDTYADATHRAWKGRALAVVRSQGKKGRATIKVSSPSLPTQTLTLRFR